MIIFINCAPLGASRNDNSVKDTRPKNLDFSTFNLPLPAITSILHRISGLFIFVGLALLLWLFSESLSSEQGFNNVAMWMDNLIVKLALWAVISGLLYHLIAGIKHLIMDMGIGETLEGAQLGAKLVVALSAISIVLTGVWLW